MDLEERAFRSAAELKRKPPRSLRSVEERACYGSNTQANLAGWKLIRPDRFEPLIESDASRAIRQEIPLGISRTNRA